MKFKHSLLTIFLLLTLAACGANSGAVSQPVPTVVLNTGNADTASAPVGASASGIVVPHKEASLAFTIGGNVKKVYVAQGDKVQAGDLLVELENTAAQTDLMLAQRNLKELTSPAAIAAAELAVANARQAVKDAQDDINKLSYARASDTLIKNTQGEVDLAKKQLALATDAYKQYSRRPDGDTIKAQALVNMTNAQLRLNDLQSKLNWYVGKPSDIDAAIIQATFDNVQADLQQAQWYLSALKNEPIPAEATGTQLATLEAAQSKLDSAQERFDQTRLVAPISGEVTMLEIIQGEFAAPGQNIVIVSQTDQFEVETTDLSERDIPKVSIGQTASVLIKPLNQTVTGKVISIAPLSTTVGGDVVYKATISLDTQPKGALSGMSAEISFQ